MHSIFGSKCGNISRRSLGQPVIDWSYKCSVDQNMSPTSCKPHLGDDSLAARVDAEVLKRGAEVWGIGLERAHAQHLRATAAAVVNWRCKVVRFRVEYAGSLERQTVRRAALDATMPRTSAIFKYDTGFCRALRCKRWFSLNT